MRCDRIRTYLFGLLNCYTYDVEFGFTGKVVQRAFQKEWLSAAGGATP